MSYVEFKPPMRGERYSPNMTPDEIKCSHYQRMVVERQVYLSISTKDCIPKLSSRFGGLRHANLRNDDRDPGFYFLCRDQAEQSEDELSSLLEKYFKRYEELVSIKDRICEVITVVILLRYSFQFSPNSQLRSKALALFEKLKEHEIHNKVWSSTLKTLNQEFHVFYNQGSLFRATPPLIKILCLISRLSYQQLHGFISDFQACPFGFKNIEEQLWEGGQCKAYDDLREDRWAVIHGFLKIDGNVEDDVKKEVLRTIKRAQDIYFEAVRGGKVNGDRREAALEAYSCMRREESLEIDME